MSRHDDSGRTYRQIPTSLPYHPGFRFHLEFPLSTSLTVILYAGLHYRIKLTLPGPLLVASHSLELPASNGVMASNPLTPDKSTLGDKAGAIYPNAVFRCLHRWVPTSRIRSSSSSYLCPTSTSPAAPDLWSRDESVIVPCSQHLCRSLPKLSAHQFQGCQPLLPFIHSHLARRTSSSRTIASVSCLQYASSASRSLFLSMP